MFTFVASISKNTGAASFDALEEYRRKTNSGVPLETQKNTFRKKNEERMKKFVTLCAVALASLVLFSACSKSETPEEVAVKFMMELNNENYDVAKTLANEHGAQVVDLMKSMNDMSAMGGETETSEAVEGAEGEATPEEAAPAPKEEKVKFTEADFEVKKSEVRGDSAFVWVLNKKEEVQGEFPLVLVKDGGKWKVDKIDKENK